MLLMHRILVSPFCVAPVVISLFLVAAVQAESPGVVLPGKAGPLAGKHVVLIAADDEYRSEELIPQLAKILAVRHGCQCTVLFAVNPKTGFIDPGAEHPGPGGPRFGRSHGALRPISRTA